MQTRNYTSEDEAMWDQFVEKASMGTLLHSRRFLSYHGERFRDRSILIDQDGVLQALLPAAEAPGDSQTIISHPGITYGGLLVTPSQNGEGLLDILSRIMKHYRAMGYRRLLYKAVPYIYHRLPSQDDLYALFRLGANRYRCDLSGTIDLAHRGKIGSRRKRGLSKARKAGVTISSGSHHIPALWSVLTENLATKHHAQPVHTLEEIKQLAERFPKEINIIVALKEDQVIAGIVLFNSTTVSHAQYISSSASGHEVNALDLVFEHSIDRANSLSKRYFDFGISNENFGSVLNNGLYTFKREFGSGGVVHEFYELSLASEACSKNI